jgi:hypothetical protein
LTWLTSTHKKVIVMKIRKASNKKKKKWPGVLRRLLMKYKVRFIETVWAALNGKSHSIVPKASEEGW